VTGQRAYDPCGSNGQPDSTQRVPCSGNTSTDTSWQVCRTGVCVDSANTTAGYTEADVDGTWGTTPIVANRWRVGTITIPANLELKVFELHAVLAGVPNPTDGRTIRLALWNEKTDAGGRQPGTLVAYTSLKIATNGLNILPITATSKPQLTPGATYWIGINISTTGSTLAQRGGTGDVVTYSPAPISDVPIDTMMNFPDVAPSYAISDYALYILGKDAL
jgi:hypothetical protein